MRLLYGGLEANSTPAKAIGYSEAISFLLYAPVFLHLLIAIPLGLLEMLTSCFVTDAKLEGELRRFLADIPACIEVRITRGG